MSHIMLVGIQGSGKGTQARKILEKYGDFVLFEMGTELKKFAQTDSPEGQETKRCVEAGLKAPTSAVVKMAENFLENNSGKKVLLDGVIRSKEQNDNLEHIFGEFDVIYLDLDVETAVERLAGRRVDPVTSETFPASFTGDTNPKTGNKLITRVDDTPDAIRKRIAWSIADTLPLIEVWRDHDHKIFQISANQSEEAIFAEIEKIVQG
ncbi:nucleoside monophosphate kinase [Candidatus Gracilibacteria bacterium]|nr:nucleoside monophosphate kinase [Candidatus Gracilibacteria bacterium]